MSYPTRCIANATQFYSLYKQGTIGDVNSSRPGMLDFVGKAKWDAWKSVEGKSKEDAQSEYVAALQAILEKGSDEDSKKYLAELNAA